MEGMRGRARLRVRELSCGGIAWGSREVVERLGEWGVTYSKLRGAVSRGQVTRTRIDARAYVYTEEDLRSVCVYFNIPFERALSELPGIPGRRVNGEGRGRGMSGSFEDLEYRDLDGVVDRIRRRLEGG